MTAASALDARVLVLNKLYSAVRVVDARRAFTLLAKGAAEVISPESGSYVSYNLTTWAEAAEFQREFEPLGSERTVRVDVRVIAATNRDLRQLASEGKFQEDLYYRLNVIPLAMPALRERREDIPLLVEYFVKRHAERAGKRVTGVAPDALTLLNEAPWPGNVRELENTIERAVVLSAQAAIQARDIVLVGAISPPQSSLPSLNLKQIGRAHV